MIFWTGMLIGLFIGTMLSVVIISCFAVRNYQRGYTEGYDTAIYDEDLLELHSLAHEKEVKK